MAGIDHGDVRWAFFDILGRDPNDPGGCDWHVANAQGNADNLRAAILASAEAQSRNGISSHPSVFCSYKPRAPKLLVVGNCQAPNIARYLAIATSASTLGIEVMYNGSPDIFDQLAQDADYIVMPELSAQFGDISIDAIRKKYAGIKPIITYSPFYFTGEQPDLVYWGGRGARFPSPLGDYHSRIVLRSFIDGLSLGQCMQSYNEQVFQELGYFDSADRSMQETLRREMSCDVKIGDYIQSSFGRQRLCLSVNHPTSAVFAQLSQRISRALGIEAVEVCIQSFTNTLLGGVVWPLHPLIAEHHGMTVPPSTDYFRSGVMLTHEDFLRRSYAVYERAGRDNLLTSAARDQQVNVLGSGHPALSAA